MDDPTRATAPAVSRPPTAVLRGLVSAMCWILAILCIGLASAWMVAGSSYWLDLLANLGAQVLFFCIVIGGLVALLRRWRALIAVGVACLLQLLPLVRHRAAFWPASISGTTAPGAVRFLHYNDSSMSDAGAVYRLIEDSGADVVSILSPPVQMQTDVFLGHGLETAFAGKLVRKWMPAADAVNTEISPGFVVSRWPITRIDCEFLGPMGKRFMCGRVERPAGRFAIVAVHPRSPRNETRWREGNQVVEALVVLARKLTADHLPIVVLADLNGTPTGWRSREACGTGGLLRAKPLLHCAGTYPDVVPLNIRTGRTSSAGAIWPLSIAIDDALISADVLVEGWSTRERLKSEHCPVIIDLRIPEAKTSGSNPSGR